MAMTRGAMARRPTDAHAMIERIDISAFSIPTDAPESDGTCEWISSTLALVEAHVGAECELSYTYADAATAWLIHDQFVHLVVGLDASAVSRGGSKWPARRAVRSEGQAVKSAVVFVAGRGPRLRIGLWHVDLRRTRSSGCGSNSAVGRREAVGQTRSCSNAPTPIDMRFSKNTIQMV